MTDPKNQLQKLLWKIIDWMQKYPRHTIIVVVSVFLMPLIIVHLLFKWSTGIAFLDAEWDAGDLLSYIAGFETLLGTLVLGLITVNQAERADKVNERLSIENNSLQKIAVQKLIPMLKVISVDVSDSVIVDHAYIRFDNLITVEEHFTVDSFGNSIETYIKQVGNTEAYKKTVQLTLENISESIIRKISFDQIVFPGFRLCGQEVAAITCVGERKYKSIGTLLMPGERLHIAVNIYYDHPLCKSFWEFKSRSNVGEFNMCIYVTNTSMRDIKFQEKILISKGTGLKENIMYSENTEDSSSAQLNLQK